MKGMGYALEHLPTDAVRNLVSLVGADAVAPLEEIALAVSQKKPIAAPPLLRQWTESGLPDYRWGVLRFKERSYRRSDALAYPTIDDMLGNGQVRFALAMKQSPIRAVLRNERSWRVECEDERMRKIVQGAMQHLFKRRAKDMLDCLPYGAMFFEKVFDRRSAAEWGIKDVRGNFYGYDDLKPIHPRSIDHIRYKDDGHTFDGFVQEKSVGGKIPVPQETALIITYDQMFRNLWGNPATEKMYPFWFWLELCWRAFLRYLERTGTPVTIVEAPQHGTVIGPDDVEYGTMEYALMMAGYIMNSNAAAMPSDVDENGNTLWNVRFLQDQSRGDQFIKAIERLATGLSRSVVVGDMVGQQASTGSGGSYNQGQQHWEVTQLHNEEVIIDLLSQVDRYVAKDIVIYNGSARTPPATLETQTLDPRHRERLFDLFKIIGNQQGSEAFRTVNWRKVMDENQIPALTQAEIDQEFEHELARQKKRQDVLTPPDQQGKPGGSPKPKPKPGQTPQPPGRSSVRQTQAWVDYQISSGAVVPMLVTAEQALDMFDRTVRDRPKTFDMSVESEADVDAQIDRIIREVMAEIDTEGLSPEEQEHLRDYILGLLGLRRAEVQASQGLVVIELGLRKVLGNIFRKVRNVIDRVVKRVTGKDLADWKGTRAGSPGRGKYVPATGAIVTKDGQVWNPADHPRDPSGRWAEKGAGEEAEQEEPPEEAGYQKHLDLFALENWGKTTRGGAVVSTIEVDGYAYGSVGEVDPETFARAHEIRLRIAERAKGVDYPLEQVPMMIFNVGDTPGLAAYFGVPKEQVRDYLDETGGLIAMWEYDGPVLIDNRLIREDPDAAESMIFHEMLHGQPRSGEQSRFTSLAYDPDEITTTILTMQYGEEYNLPVFNGYPVWVSWAAEAAIQSGWSKQELYNWARQLHQEDGLDYTERVTRLFERAGVDTWDWTEGGGYIEHQHPTALENFWSGWEEDWRRVTDVYDLDWREFVDKIWGRG